MILTLRWILWAVIWLPICILMFPFFGLVILVAFISSGPRDMVDMAKDILMIPKRKP